MPVVYRVRITCTDDELLARQIGEHFYATYKAAAAKREELLRELTQRCLFQTRCVKDAHEETDRCFEQRNIHSSRTRIVGTATRLADGSFGTCEYLVCTPWVEFTIIETEDTDC